MSEEKEDKNKTVSKEFINSIKNWVALDDKIKKLKEDMKTLTNEKKEYEDIVLKELDNMDEKVIAISDGKLRKNVSKTQTPLKKELIQKTLLEYLKDEKKAIDIFDSMNKSRQTVERVNLKRIKNRDTKDSKIFEKSS
jgi:hypothetical protein